jgi:hypothetical protein
VGYPKLASSGPRPLFDSGCSDLRESPEDVSALGCREVGFIEKHGQNSKVSFSVSLCSQQSHTWKSFSSFPFFTRHRRSHGVPYV